MDFDRLVMFLKIVEAGSLSAASQLVHLTQPALSRNLKLLEEELGALLFERRGRRLVLTAAGRALIPRARQIVEQNRLTRQAIEQVARRGYHDLRLGTVDSVATWLLPQVVQPLLAEFPDIHVKLTTGRTRALLEEVRVGSLDVAILAASKPPQGLRALRVGPYRLHFFGSAARFPALADATTAEDLQRFPLVELKALPGQPSLITDDADSYAVANSLASVKALVLAGFGIGPLLEFMLTPDEEAQLVRAQVADDPDCALYVVAGDAHVSRGKQSEVAHDVEALLVDALRAAYPAGTTGRA